MNAAAGDWRAPGKNAPACASPRRNSESNQTDFPSFASDATRRFAKTRGRVVTRFFPPRHASVKSSPD